MSDSDSERHPLDRLAEDFVSRRRRGETPSVSEYVRQHPDQADEIRDLFPALALIEQVRPESADGGSRSSGTPVEPLPEQLGDFRILREIGRGGMGIVYEAEQESLGRRVALKVLPEEASRNPRYLQRFEREAQAAARLHHTNIVPVFGVGQHEGRHFFVMQYIPGCGLDEVLRDLCILRDLSAGDLQTQGVSTQSWEQERRKSAVRRLPSLTPPSGQEESDWSSGHEADSDDRVQGFSLSADRHRRRAASGRQATAGGSAAGSPELGSQAGTGDSLEDGNVSRSSADLLADGAAAFDSRYWRNVARIGVQAARGLHYAHSQGTLHRDIKPGNLLLDDEGTVWIADFGLARMAEQEDLTRTGDLIGTLRYMAPEQFAGSSDARSDVYSLGLTLYELLTLRPACDETDRGRLIRQITDAAPPPPRQLNPAIPRDLETIVLKAISRELPHRYQQASELAEDLGRWLEDRPIRARRARWGERLWRWSRRNRLAASLAGVTVVAVVLAAVTGWTGYVSTASALERASARRDEALAATSRAEANMALSLNALEQIFETLSTDSEWDSRNSSRDDIRLPGPPPPRPRGPEQNHDHNHDHSSDRDADRPYRGSGAEAGRPPGGPGGAEASTRDAELLQTVLAFYDRFAELNSTNPELEREAARAHMRVAGLLLRRGQYELSVTAAGQAKEIFSRLLKSEPDDPVLLRGLATSHGCLARALELQYGNDAGDWLADTRYRSAEHVWLQVIAQKTDDVAYDELDLAHTRLDWAQVLMRQEQLDETVQLLRDSAARLRRLRTEFRGPAEHRLCSLLGDSLGRLADALTKLGYTGQATAVKEQRREVENDCGLPPDRRFDGPPQEGPEPLEGRYREGPFGGRPGGLRWRNGDRPPPPRGERDRPPFRDR